MTIIITDIDTSDIVAAAETIQLDAESLEWNFQTSQWHVVEQGMLSGRVDDDLRWTEPSREIPEKFHQWRDVMDNQSLGWLIHLRDAVNLQYNHSVICSDSD